jgi:integrase
MVFTVASDIKNQGLVERIPDSGIWWIRWTDHAGRRHLEKVGRRGDAVALLAKRRRETLLRRKAPEYLNGRTATFGDLAIDALTHSRETNGERSTAELQLKLRIIGERFNSVSADEITRSDIQKWLLEEGEERDWSPATRNRYHAAFSLVFRLAVENGKLTHNPAAQIKRKPEFNDRIRFLSADEENRLTAALRESWPQYLPAFLISIHTGMRAGEQFGLRWSDVSLERKSIALHKTKTGKTRHIPLNTIAHAAFRELQSRQKIHEEVFLNTEGNPMRRARDWFEPALLQARIRDYTWHCNRHTFASRLVMAGVDIRTVAQLLGHSTIQMTMRYAHLAPEHSQAAVERLVSSPEVVTKSVTGFSSGRAR